MPLDFLSVKQQIQRLAADAPAQLKHLEILRRHAGELLSAYAAKGAELRAKVEQAAAEDSFLRAAKPTDEALNATFPLPAAPAQATIIAADGSQISPSRHEAMNYFLINLGAIQLTPSTGETPTTFTRSELHVAEYDARGSYTEDMVAQARDKGERVLLAELARAELATAELAAKSPQLIFTLTDGPLELWGGRSRDPDELESFAKHFEDYLAALRSLHAAGAATAGYVDKPRADLVVRALEVAATPQDQLADMRHSRPLRGVTDYDLFAGLLAPGARSAIFALQSQLSPKYDGALALHFFYLNVGSQKTPWLARVEMPAWVAESAAMLNGLHALLIGQCNVMGILSYPYALHRAHEIAIVSREEKDQVTQMLLAEWRAQGLTAGVVSHKQAIKDLPGRTRS
ncbi:MAG: DNA double-strand break repair nuclease NurA [Anaerolineales bacterium]